MPLPLRREATLPPGVPRTATVLSLGIHRAARLIDDVDGALSFVKGGAGDVATALGGDQAVPGTAAQTLVTGLGSAGKLFADVNDMIAPAAGALNTFRGVGDLIKALDSRFRDDVSRRNANINAVAASEKVVAGMTATVAGLATAGGAFGLTPLLVVGSPLVIATAALGFAAVGALKIARRRMEIAREVAGQAQADSVALGRTVGLGSSVLAKFSTDSSPRARETNAASGGIAGAVAASIAPHLPASSFTLSVSTGGGPSALNVRDALEELITRVRKQCGELEAFADHELNEDIDFLERAIGGSASVGQILGTIDNARQQIARSADALLAACADIKDYLSTI